MKYCTMSLEELLNLFAKFKSEEFQKFLEDVPCHLEIDELFLELDNNCSTIKANKKKIIELLEQALQEDDSTEDEDELSSDRSPKPPTDEIER